MLYLRIRSSQDKGQLQTDTQLYTFHCRLLQMFHNIHHSNVLDSKVHGTNMGPIWGWQYPGGPQVGPMNIAIWGLMNVMTTQITGKFRLISTEAQKLAINYRLWRPPVTSGFPSHKTVNEENASISRFMILLHIFITIALVITSKCLVTSNKIMAWSYIRNVGISNEYLVTFAQRTHWNSMCIILLQETIFNFVR